ncbi:major facilitator superfamily transporter [Fusarium mexicanum]|uniref:Major facilitator superfamily transporter n=1 Tax=Fusarium mexicanum TaxID=751941 RepID=A0A8H5I2R5_9HYPO|nr:major facilitator superfamily transporter [Fusarium mexicanum]
MSPPLKENLVDTSIRSNDDALDLRSPKGEDILESELEDEVLALKTRLVNDANDDLGWTPFHWKLFFLNGFGYAVDSLLTMVQGVTGPQAFLELATASSYVNAGVVAQNVGLVVGALFWGFGADILGRRLAFNLTLWITSLAMIIGGAAPNLSFLCAFLALSTFGSGGNLILDPTVLLEFLPSNKQWVVTALAGWWGFGQSITGFIAWGFMTQSRWNCSTSDDCGWNNNAGWRYVMFTCGALVFVLSVLRVTVIRLVETPKYLLANGRDADLVKYYQDQARKYNRPCTLTLEKLQACGEIRLKHNGKRTLILSDVKNHVKGLFVSRNTTLSTLLIWASWAIMGLAYPLFYVFLPAYLSTRVPGKVVSQFETYRNLTLTTISGIPGPLIAGYLVETKLGRKYTMFIGALSGMALFFGITGIKTDKQNVGISCAICRAPACCINIYYSTFYAYTAEVLPSAHRATGSGIAVSFNRIMGIVSAFVASSGNTATAVPLYVCAALFGGLALIAALFPFEPNGRRSS